MTLNSSNESDYDVVVVVWSPRDFVLASALSLGGNRDAVVKRDEEGAAYVQIAFCICINHCKLLQSRLHPSAKNIGRHPHEWVET